MSEAPAVEAALAEPAVRTRRRAPRGKFQLGLWEGIALLVGLASDFAKPLGNYSLYLLAGGGVLALLLFFLRRFDWARGAFGHAAFFTALMAGVLALQLFGTADGEGKQRGVTVALLPALGPVQTRLLPLPPEQKELLAFKDAIASGAENDRVAVARELYAASRSDGLKRAMIEAMMASDSAALRQSAILLRLRERDGDRLALPPLNRDATDPLSRRLLSYNFAIRTVDVESGGLSLIGDGYGSDGTVAREALTMQLYIDIAPGDRRLMLVELRPEKGMKLTGEARLDSGEKVRVELPLF